jgi:hypothetical protein
LLPAFSTLYERSVWSLDRLCPNRKTCDPRSVIRRSLLQVSIYHSVSLNVEYRSVNLPLSMLLYSSSKQCILALRPLSFLQASSYRVVPSLPTIFVRSPGETGSDYTPVKHCQHLSIATGGAVLICVMGLVPVFDFAIFDH